MSNVEITKRHENATTDKLNVNPRSSAKKFNSLIFRRLEVVHSLPPLDTFELSENQATKMWKQVLTLPPKEMQVGEYEVIVPAYPRPCLVYGGRGGVQMTGG